MSFLKHLINSFNNKKNKVNFKVFLHGVSSDFIVGLVCQIKFRYPLLLFHTMNITIIIWIVLNSSFSVLNMPMYNQSDFPNIVVFTMIDKTFSHPESVSNSSSILFIIDWRNNQKICRLQVRESNNNLSFLCLIEG